MPSADQPRGGERLERPQRRRLSERSIARAVGELQHLREHLDLADAAAADLDVAIEIGLLALGALLEAEDLLERRMIEVAPVDERLDQLEEALAQLEVAGERPRLEQREALEGLAPGVVVLGVLPQRVGDVAAPAHRPQPQVDAVEIALVGELGQYLHQRAGELVEEAMVGVVVFVVGLVDEDEVDVRAVVELAPAQLAHAEDDEAPRQPIERRRLRAPFASRCAARAR